MKKLVLSAVILISMGLVASCGNKTTDNTSKADKSITSTANTASTSSKSTSTKLDTEEKSQIAEVDPTKVYVGADYIKALIDGNLEESKDYVILEAAWGELDSDSPYNKGHIKGAVHINTDYIESEEFWNIRDAKEIADVLKKYGITKDTTVVLYSNDPFVAADDRVAIAFLWAGVSNVKSLSGGIDAWKKAGYELETTMNNPKGTDKEFGAVIPVHPEYILSIEEVKEKLNNDKNFKLVSIRSKAEFDGETSGYGYIDRAGEPLGAVWGHDTDDGSYNNEDGSVVGMEKLLEYLKDAGVKTENEISFYCGTGWRASIPFLIAYENGLKNISLYDGGWYEWQMDSENPVQLGEPNTADYKEVKVNDLTTDKAKK